MSRLSGHLSQVGALVVAIVAAAVAYSMYDGDTTTSNTQARNPVAGVTADRGESRFVPASRGRESANRVMDASRAGRTAGANPAEGPRSFRPSTGPQAHLSEAPLQDVSAPLQDVSAPLQDVSAPAPDVSSPPPEVSVPRVYRRHRVGLPRGEDDGGMRHRRDHDRGRRPGPFDDRTLDRELHRLIGDRPLPRVPKGPAEEIPTDLTTEPIEPTPNPAPAHPDVSQQPVAPPPPAPVAPPSPSPTPATSGGSGSTDTTVTTPPPPTTTQPPPAPTEPAPAPANPDDQIGNADDEDAGMDEQSGEAEDESPVPPGGSEGADGGVPGDGDDAAAPPATADGAA